jgi:hypothetical protein
MMQTSARKPWAFWLIVKAANPVFVVIAIVVPVAALIVAISVSSKTPIYFVHIMFGALWTGIDVFMGFILGPVLGGMAPKDRADVFKRLTPKMTFAMPVLAAVTLTGGTNIAQRLGILTLYNPRVLAAAILALILTIQGFAILLPNEIRILKQLLSPQPDTDRIGRLGMRNARLGGIQAVLQFGMIFVMVIIAP